MFILCLLRTLLLLIFLWLLPALRLLALLCSKRGFCPKLLLPLLLLLRCCVRFPCCALAGARGEARDSWQGRAAGEKPAAAPPFLRDVRDLGRQVRPRCH